MKKNILRTTAIAFLAFASILFTSCFDPIYHTIRTDVKPEKPTVSGYISSIARYNVGGKEYLVTAADRGLRYKPSKNEDHGSWKVYNKLPFDIVHSIRNGNTLIGKYIAKVVSDKDYLYLMTVEFNSDNTAIKPELFALKITDWNSNDNKCTKVELPKELKILFLKEGENNITRGGFNIFSTNDYDNNKREAYIRIGDERLYTDDKTTEDIKTYAKPVYAKLGGIKASELSITSKAGELDKGYGGINSAIATKNVNEPFFFNTPVAAYGKINDTYNIYIAVGKTLYHSQDSLTLKFEPKITFKSDIASLAPTYDSILVGCGNDKTGTAGGIHKVEYINSGEPRDKESEFNNNNAKVQLPASYMVPVLLNDSPLDENYPEGKAIIYGSANFAGLGANYNNRIENIGLWSYYPTRGNWNRE